MPARLPLLVTLLLFASLLFAAGPGHAAALESSPVAFALEEPFEGEEEFEEGEFEVEVFCDEAEVEFELGEISEAEADEICSEEAAESRRKKAGGALAPEECVLRSAHAHAAINEKSNKLKLTLGYTAYEPAGAKIKLGNIATVQRKLGRSGVLRIVEDIGEKQPKRLAVRLDVAAVPGWCGKYLVEKIRVS